VTLYHTSVFSAGILRMILLALSVIFFVHYSYLSYFHHFDWQEGGLVGGFDSG
jgi:hypothetical protein